jgi:stage II sporulation protein D
MAQYGARGFAEHGWRHDQILAHYFPGTELGPAPASRIRVLLAQGRGALEIGSEGPFYVKDAGRRVKLPAGTYRLGPDLTLDVGGKLRTLASPVRFQPGKKPLRLGRPYRGWIDVSLANGKLTAVNDVGLEQYLRGVVAGEMPPDWHPEALEVQAICARSFALAGRKTGGLFDVYADTRSQVYGGIEAEDPRTDAAVEATRSQVVLFQGNVAWTFFSASSGGRTAAIEDVWLGSEPLPYLVSVDDPYDDISPYHRWGPLTFTAEELEKKLGSRLPDGLTDLVANLNPSGRVSTVTAAGAGGTTEISGWSMRMVLGLRSTWFEIGRLGDLVASARRIVYGRRVLLTGVAGTADAVTIERRPDGGAWADLRTVEPNAGGRFKTTVRPRVTTSFRARFGQVLSRPVHVAVAPKVTFDEKQRKRGLSGVVRPVLQGATVTIERRGSADWKAVASAVVDGEGRFRARFRVRPGDYRARVEATARLVGGTSRALTIDAG